jgi:hypothetical protein
VGWRKPRLTREGSLPHPSRQVTALTTIEETHRIANVRSLLRLQPRRTQALVAQGIEHRFPKPRKRCSRIDVNVRSRHRRGTRRPPTYAVHRRCPIRWPSLWPSTHRARETFRPTLSAGSHIHRAERPSAPHRVRAGQLTIGAGRDQNRDVGLPPGLANFNLSGRAGNLICNITRCWDSVAVTGIPVRIHFGMPARTSPPCVMGRAFWSEPRFFDRDRSVMR